jgi:hypothetical protein
MYTLCLVFESITNHYQWAPLRNRIADFVPTRCLLAEVKT